MLTNPVPTSSRKNNGGYPADSGLDILTPVGTLCVAAADGTIEYAEHGHTPWMEDTNLAVPGIQYPYSIRIALDVPITWQGRKYPWIWYTHMTALAAGIEGANGMHVRAGTPLGRSGIGNKVPHLHFGIIADREQTITMPFQEVAVLIWDGVDAQGGAGTSGGGGEPPAPAGTPEPEPVATKHHVVLFVHEQAIGLQIDGAPVGLVDATWETKVDAGALTSFSGLFSFVAPVGPADTHAPPPGVLKLFAHNGRGTAVLYGQEFTLAELVETVHVVPGKPAGMTMDMQLVQG